MKRIIPLIIMTAFFLSINCDASTILQDNPVSGEILSVKITDGAHTAVFQLYDNAEARTFYDLLPLKNLELSNLRNVQWIFSLPDKLPVTSDETCHAVKKGELRYYKALGNVSMSYSDFNSEEELYRLGVNITGIDEISAMSGSISVEKVNSEQKTTVKERNIVNIKIEEHILTATLADNSSARALMKLLADKPLTIKMVDYGGMEKVGSFGTDLPVNDEQITTKAGDLILYQGDKLVIYYAPNSWNFTRLGKIDNISAAELKKILGNGNVTVELYLSGD